MSNQQEITLYCKKCGEGGCSCDTKCYCGKIDTADNMGICFGRMERVCYECEPTLSNCNTKCCNDSEDGICSK